MGGLKHVVKRRVHLERAQPKHRVKLGLLEKRQDYLKRAKDYHGKRVQWQQLVEKARLRNPEEYSRRMTGLRLDEKGILRKIVTPPTDKEKLAANSVDRRTVELRRSVQKRVVEKSVASSVPLPALVSGSGQRTLFTDEDDEVHALRNDPDLDDDKVMLQGIAKVAAAAALNQSESHSQKALAAAREFLETSISRQAALEDTKARTAQLDDVLHNLEVSKHRMEEKSTKQKLLKVVKLEGGKKFPVYAFRRKK